MLASACGTSSNDGGGAPGTAAGESLPAATEAPAPTTTLADDPPTAATAEPADATEAGEESAPLDEPAPADEPAPESTAPAPESTAPPPESTAPPPTEPPAPEPAPLGGRALGEALRPESATDSNPFSDLLVADVSRDTDVNVANLIPAPRPLLVWAWAPH